MTEADSSFLQRACPDVLLALMAMQMHLNRIDQREETENLLLDTGNTVKRERSLEKAIELEKTARAACHEMLRRIGTLPQLGEEGEFEILLAPKSNRRKPIAPSASRKKKNDTYSDAAAQLGAK